MVIRDAAKSQQRDQQYHLAGGELVAHDRLRRRPPRRREAVRSGSAWRHAAGGVGRRYSFTKLNDVKPQMVAAATKDARAAAEQFAKDAGSGVGGIKSATQGYFSIDARDGEGGDGSSDTPYKKVRVVTTVDFYLK